MCALWLTVMPMAACRLASRISACHYISCFARQQGLVSGAQCECVVRKGSDNDCFQYCLTGGTTKKSHSIEEVPVKLRRRSTACSFSDYHALAVFR